MSRKLFEGKRKKDALHLLRDQLDSNDPDERKNAAKKVVNLMRAGENVGELFASMLRCVKTDDLELKRLVYNYIVTYSQEQSEESIMVVNTFVLDSQDANPLVRALAIRTMGRIRIETVAEAMIIPLKQCLQDKDPFVRKTAALAVVKVYDTIPEAVENAELFKLLINLMYDENPMVVSNTTAAILEINQKRSSPIFTFDGSCVPQIVAAIPASTEWCQTILLDALGNYEPDSPEKAAEMIDRLMPFLKSANPSVVIGAFKCIFLFMDFDDRRPQDLFGQILPPFITLVNSAEPEIQYVVLRTLSLFVQKYPKALSKEVRVFFCKYNDPSYIKMEKLDIIISTCLPSNVNPVLDELAEYCNSVDVHFVKKTVRVIGQLALKIPPTARRCVDILVKLVEGKATYAVEAAIVVVADLLRRFPGEFESIIGQVCKNIEKLSDPAAKVALVWILGEYNGLIEHVDVLLDPFLDTFHDEVPDVQIQIVTAFVKVYLQSPETSKDQLQFLLSEATKESVLPDVRNRAMIYWRLLSLDPAAAKSVVNFSKDKLSSSTVEYEDEVLLELIRNMGCASGILHVLPSKFASVKVHDNEDEDEGERNWHDVKLRNPSSPVSITADWSSQKYYLQITNLSNAPLTQLALAVNGNGVGLSFPTFLGFPDTLGPSSTCAVDVEYTLKQEDVKGTNTTIDFALRTSAGIVYFTDFVDFLAVVKPKFRMWRADFLRAWQEIQDKVQFQVMGMPTDNDVLASRGIFVVGDRGGEICAAFELPGGRVYMADVEYGSNQMRLTVKGEPFLFPFIQENARNAFCFD